MRTLKIFKGQEGQDMVFTFLAITIFAIAGGIFLFSEGKNFGLLASGLMVAGNLFMVISWILENAKYKWIPALVQFFLVGWFLWLMSSA